ncbi:MAG: DUF1893 domain-containing protein [Muribaculum sp.]|nr:DUF1893 domain-containing protein [Muribaculum sp.]
MIDRLVDILHSGNHSLVVDNGEIHTFDGRGVRDLYHIYTTAPQILKGASLADKVVGKGAAALMALGGVKQIHADVISRPALTMLESDGITVTYSILVDNIINRKGTGMCPVETLCFDCTTAEECYPKITQFLTPNT